MVNKGVFSLDYQKRSFMSTKVYNGIKFKSKNIKEILDQLISIKKEAVDLGNKSITRQDIEYFILTNKNMFGVPLIETTDSWDVFDGIKMDMKKDFRTTESINFLFSVMIYPSDTGDIYGYFFNDLRTYEDLLLPISDEFGYWDNTDAPDEFNTEEGNKLWEARGEIWDKLIPGKFNATGFNFDIVGPDDFSKDDMLPLIVEALSYLKRDKQIEKILK